MAMAKKTTEETRAEAKAKGIEVTVSTEPKGATGEVAPLPGAPSRTALKAITEATAKAGVTLHVHEPKPGTGTVTFLSREKDLLEDDDGSGVVE